MWSLIIQPITKLWSQLLLIALPWLQRFLFNSAVKKASSGALKKTPLSFYAPNLIATAICVCLINGVHFAITLWFTDGVAVSLISAGSVTLVTAFFLLRGFFCEHTKRERTILFIVLIVFFGLFVLFRVYIDIPWLALVVKLTLEVIFCFAVMLSELRRLNHAQTKAVEATMRKLRISPEGFIGKMIVRFFVPKVNIPEDTENDASGEMLEVENDTPDTDSTCDIV